MILYGIRNCDTMKKAQAWLQVHAFEYRMHDYRRDGLEAQRLQDWCSRLGWQALINTRGTTWRRLTPEQQSIATTADAVRLMLEQPALIRRPVLETPEGRLLIGFEPQRYVDFLKTGLPHQA